MTDILTPVLTAHWDQPDLFTIDGYRRAGGYQALPKALGMSRDEVIAIVKSSGLRGRGGAMFPTGVKWGFLPQGDDKPHYLVVNADESEPGACKDVPLMMATPHTLIEGAAIAAYAIGAGHAFIYVRGEVLHVIRRLRNAVQEARAAGYLGQNILGSGFDLEVIIHAGAGAYICGEETALLDSLEGKRGLPRNKPPFPAVAGVYASPTNVNNVESIASAPAILLNGADWFASMGTEKTKGCGIFNLSGHITTPGTFEAPFGITLRELLELSGGMRGGRRLKFWTAGGSSAGILTDQHLDLPLDFESVAAAGSQVGTRSVMIFDDTTCVVGAVLRWTEFYQHESCGKCTPCREGTFWLVRILDRLEHGDGTEEDVEKLLDICDNITGRAFCALGDSATPPITSAVKYFRDEFIQHHKEGGCPFDPAASTVWAEGVGGSGGSSVPGGGGGAPPPGREVNRERVVTVETTRDTVTVTIDGFEIAVPKGMWIIRAAELLGIAIPRFCEHPLLEPIGACRQCLVEVEGQRKPLASCITACTEGMVVHTQLTSAVADKAQQGVMEMLLINHPLDCPMCDKGGECPLQNQAMSNGRGETRFTFDKRTFDKPVAISTEVLLDRERCISCTRCTRTSEEIAGDAFIEFLGRGPAQMIGTAEGKPFNSYFSGNTVQVCPVGALTGAAYRFRSRPYDLVSVPSVCEHCASGCRQRTDVRRGRVMRRLAGEEPLVNEEWNCDKGRWAFTYATQPDRLTSPLVRDPDGRLVPASWPHALAVAAAGLVAARNAARDADAERPRGVGVLAGGRLTLEDAYAYAKFARVALDTNDVDMRARAHSAEEEQFLAACVAGRDIAVSYADLERAPAVLLAGFEPEDESPIVFLRLRKAVRHHKLPVFSIAALATPGLAKLSGALLATLPGDEAAALTALTAGDVASTPGWKSADAEAADESWKNAGQALGEAGAVILVGERLAVVPGALAAAARLAFASGARLAWVPRRAGERGAVEAGALPGLLPIGRQVSDPAARAEVARAWGKSALPSTPGRDTTAMLTAAADRELGALVVAGVDPADLPDPRAALHAIEMAPFVVSLELRVSAVTDRADVVFPVAAVAEKAGTFVNWEGRGGSFGTALRVPEVRTDLYVLGAIADQMDVHLGLPDAAAARAELAALGAWRGTRPEPPATTAWPAETPARTSGGLDVRLASWHQLLDSGRMQDGEPALAGTARPVVARMSAATAAEAGLADGDKVTVVTDRGSVTVPVELVPMADHAVWLPAAGLPGGTTLRAELGAGHGAMVTLRRPE